MAEESSWDQTIDDWLCGEEALNACCAGGLAQQEDGMFYAAAPVAAEAGWALIYKEDHEEDVLQEDGETTKKQTISESVALKGLASTGKAPQSGLWFAGEKYRITRFGDEELGEKTVKWYFCAAALSANQGGAHVVVTTTQIVVGFYNEEKNQTSGNCKKAVLAFAEYLLGIGY